MKPTKQKFNYELLKCDDFIEGIIEDIERDEEHKTNFKGQEKVSDCVRFAFRLNGYQQKHKSRWLTFSYHEKSALFNLIIIPLVEGAITDFDFDIELLKGMKVKTLWAEKVMPDGKVFQYLDKVRPLAGKIKYVHNEKIDDSADVEDLNELFIEARGEDEPPF